MYAIRSYYDSGFRLEIEGAVILIDPWLTGNPMFPAGARAEALAGATHILLTHGHGDHVGDAVAIAKRANALVVSNFEIVNYCTSKGSYNFV